MPILLVQEGPDKGKSLPLRLPRGQLFCGSDPKATFSLKDTSVAPQHFRFVKDGEAMAVYALDEQAGITVNGQAVPKAIAVRIGDTICIGATTLYLAPDEGESLPAPAANETDEANDAGETAEEPLHEDDVEEALEADTEEEVGAEAPASTPAVVAASVPVTPAASVTAPSVSSKKLSDKSPSAVEVAGYRKSAEIAEGELGVVYRAVQESMGRDVALRIVRQEFSSNDAFRNAFFEQLRKAGQVNHPNIVRLLDANEAEGFLYAASEYVEGGTLEAYIASERGAVDPDTAFAVLLDISEGLTALEQAGLAHTGLSPSNILLTEEGISKIADLGLGRKLPGVAEANASPYFAPELDVSDGDIRSDMYSLGVMFYQMVSGIKPEPGANLTAAIQALGSKLSAPCVDALKKMLAWKPEDRFESASALEETLKRIEMAAVPQAAPARTPTSNQKAAGPAKLNRVAATVTSNERLRRSRAGAKSTSNPMPSAVIAIIVVVVVIAIGAGSYAMRGDKGKDALSLIESMKNDAHSKADWEFLLQKATLNKSSDLAIQKKLSEFALEAQKKVKEFEVQEAFVRDFNEARVFIGKHQNDKAAIRQYILSVYERYSGNEEARQLFKQLLDKYGN